MTDWAAPTRRDWDDLRKVARALSRRVGLATLTRRELDLRGALAIGENTDGSMTVVVFDEDAG